MGESVNRLRDNRKTASVVHSYHTVPSASGDCNTNSTDVDEIFSMLISIKSTLKEFETSQIETSESLEKLSSNHSKIEQLERGNLNQTVSLLREERDRLQHENFELKEKLDEMKSFFDSAFQSAPHFP